MKVTELLRKLNEGPHSDLVEHITVVVRDRDGAFQKAIPLLEKVTAEEPTIQMAQLQLGVARARQRQYPQAIGPLRKAIALEPENAQWHAALADTAFWVNGVRL